MHGIDGRSVRAFLTGEQPFLTVRGFVLRGAQRQPDSRLGAAHRPRPGEPQADRPADSRTLRPRCRSERAAKCVRTAAVPGARARSPPRSDHTWCFRAEHQGASRRGCRSAAPQPRICPVFLIETGKIAHGTADDPKTLAHLNTALDDAAAAWARGDAETAIRTLQALVGERPDFMVAYHRLGYVLRATGHADEAARVLDAAARGGHADRDILEVAWRGAARQR